MLWLGGSHIVLMVQVVIKSFLDGFSAILLCHCCVLLASIRSERPRVYISCSGSDLQVMGPRSDRVARLALSAQKINVRIE